MHREAGLAGWALALLCALCLLGYTVFRGSNSQKDAFRRDPTGPDVAHLRYLATRRGTAALPRLADVRRA